MVRIAALVQKRMLTHNIYFLIEEILSLWLKCPVNFELQFSNLLQMRSAQVSH
jgi:hypothetical protein